MSIQTQAQTNNNMQILVITDDAWMCQLLYPTLTTANYSVYTATNTADATNICRQNPIDLIILDISFPDMVDEFRHCQELRLYTLAPIIILMPLRNPNDIIAGFESGADDCVRKPFHISELQARIKARLRRAKPKPPANQATTVTVGDFVLDEENREVVISGQTHALSPAECHLLRYLMQHPDQLLNARQLLTEVWGYQSQDNPNVVHTIMRRLRIKLEANPASPQYLKTVRREGYLFYPGVGA